jgi:GNAT superfamily N-acetyltransferase
METKICRALTAEEIARSHPVMRQLRPHFEEATFVAQVLRQQKAGYHLAFLEAKGRVRAAAGYRFGENLAWGRFCYVDDLVTDADGRSLGFGGQLLDWLVVEAQEAGCEQFHLDSGVQRFAAHRFYLTKRMEISAHHFAMTLEGRAPSRP